MTMACEEPFWSSAFQGKLGQTTMTLPDLIRNGGLCWTGKSRDDWKYFRLITIVSIVARVEFSISLWSVCTGLPRNIGGCREANLLCQI